MKKTWVYVLLVAMILLLFGCTKRTQIGICFRDTNAGITMQLMHQLTEELKNQGYQVTAVGAANDQAEQTGQINHFLEENYDLLIVEPVMTAEAYAIVQQAQQKRVPVIFLNYEPDASVINSWEKLCYIGCDLSQPGSVQNELVGTLPDGGDVNGDGTVSYLVISGPENHMDTQTWERTCCRVPHAICLDIAHGDWSRESGETIAARYLGKYEETLDVIFCLDDEMALGALEAIQEAEKTVGEDVYLLSIGGQWQVLASVAQKEITGTVCPDITALTETTGDTVSKLLSGKTVEKWTLLDYVSVTAENAENFM